jgi:hypothetical protein
LSAGTKSKQTNKQTNKKKEKEFKTFLIVYSILGNEM